MKFLETHHLDIQERKEIEEKGLYCYDLRHSDDGCEIATIEKSVLVNRIGSMVTNEPILFDNKFPKDYIDYKEFVANNEIVNTLDELLQYKVKTRQFDENMLVIDLGYRNKQPVVLVEKTSKYGAEYIIGFNYKINDNRITWGYGYYYGNDMNKAIYDFNRVLAGENLDNTFEIYNKYKEIKNAKLKVIVEKTENKEYPYNAQIWKSTDNGDTFYFSGSGKFFKTEKEAEHYKKDIEKGKKVRLKNKDAR